MTTATVSSDPAVYEAEQSDRRAERALLERIVASRHFAKSALLCGFLRHICESHFAGRDNELSEQQIGVKVFGRQVGYDCGADNIVRNYARQLRQRLDDYYRWEGEEEPLRLEVPRGGYRPGFIELALASAATPTASSPVLLPPAFSGATDASLSPHLEKGSPDTRNIETRNLDTKSARTKNAARGWKLAGAALLLLVLAGLALSAVVHRRSVSLASPMHSFWSAVFRADRDTVIVTADSGFGTLQDMQGRRLSLADYMGLRLGTLAPENHNSESRNSENSNQENRNPYLTRDLASQRYTSMTDLETAVALSHLPEVVPSRFAIRFARDLRMEDLKDNDVILLGSAYTNPWSVLFEKSLNFQLQGDVTAHTWQFVNLHPTAGQPRVFAGERDGPSHRTYARVAWVPNLNHSGHVLLLQGIDMAGTQAAAQALLHGTSLLPTWKRTQACGSADASFEVLLGTTSIGSSAGPMEILDSRTHC